MKTGIFAAVFLAAFTAASPAYAKDCQSLYEQGFDWTDPVASAEVSVINSGSIATVEELAAAISALGRTTTIIRGGNFGGQDMSLLGGAFENVCFLGTDLEQTGWTGASLPGFGFVSSDLTGAHMVGAQLPRLLLLSSHVTESEMVGADLRGGLFAGNWGTSVRGWNVTGADLSGFRFACGITIDDGCSIDREGISFTGANLGEADISEFPTWGGTSYAGARLGRTVISPRQIVELAGAQVDGTVLIKGGDAVAALEPAEFGAVLAVATDPTSDILSPDTFDPDELPAGYFSELVRFPQSFRQTTLYRRLAPALAGASMAHITVMRGADGTFQASGEAIGANAHQCGLHAVGLRLDPANGWLTVTPDGGTPLPILRLAGDQLEVIDNGHPQDPAASEYVSCGARAGFGILRRLK